MVLKEGTVHDVLARKNPTLQILTGKGSLSQDKSWINIDFGELRPVCSLAEESNTFTNKSPEYEL